MDAVNGAPDSAFTMVPTELIRNGAVSSCAKVVLSILLSNKTGWHSYATALKDMVNEGREKLAKSLQELEELGYLIRIAYRRIDNKRRVGSFWAYTFSPYCFNIHQHVAELERMGLEIVETELTEKCCLTKKFKEQIEKPQQNQHLETQNPHYGFPEYGFPEYGDPATKYINNNNNNTNQINTSCEEDDDKITLSHFNEFWILYPRKAEKGGAFTKWKTLCNKPKKDRPAWRTIKRAILRQIESERWQESKEFIPLPTTWLNQSRWLDDPAEMRSFSKREEKKTPTNGTLYGKNSKEKEIALTLSIPQKKVKHL